MSWALKPSAKGEIQVAQDRGGPITIAYELHGHGPIHLVVLCDLSLPISNCRVLSL